MFAAKRHPLLVPHDGSFDIRKARTRPRQTQGRLEGIARRRSPVARRVAVSALCRRPPRRAARLSSTRCGRQGQHDPARLRRRESVRPARRLVQGAEQTGARARLSLAHDQASARARQCGDLQPQLLRGGARRPRAPRATRRPEATGEAVEDVLGRPPARDCRLRAASRGAGHRDPQVLVQHVEGRAAQAVARAHRGPREAVEIQRARPRRARAPRRSTCTLTSSACVRRRGRGRRGMPCRQTTSTTFVGRSRSSSTRRCNSSASISRAPTRRPKRRWRPRRNGSRTRAAEGARATRRARCATDRRRYRPERLPSRPSATSSVRI